jgi:hypothetical protein
MWMGNIYSAYNLIVDSELELPELRLLDPVGISSPPDVRVYFGGAPSEELQGTKQLGPFLRASKSSLWLDVPEVARFLIKNGNDICIEPASASEEDSVRLSSWIRFRGINVPTRFFSSPWQRHTY